MSSAQHIENPDVILIGSGVMSATLGAVLKNLQPDLKVQLYEVTDELAQESSNGWNNAGTGHAGICELSYTPNRGDEGIVLQGRLDHQEPNSVRALWTPSTMFISFFLAAQRAVWLRPQSGANDSLSAGACSRHSFTRSTMSSGVST